MKESEIEEIRCVLTDSEKKQLIALIESLGQSTALYPPVLELTAAT